MNCHEFHQNTESWLRGETPDHHWKHHMEQCQSCAQMYNEIMYSMEPTHPQDEMLTRKILAATSRKPCESIELKDDALLTPFEKKLQDYHLFTCANCRNLMAVSDQLKQDLPLLAEHRVPESLTNKLLAIYKINRYSLAHIWRSLWMRPRFSLEFSYVLALVFWIGISLTPDHIFTAPPILKNGRSTLQNIKEITKNQWNGTLNSVKHTWDKQVQQAKTLSQKAVAKSEAMRRNSSQFTARLKKSSKNQTPDRTDQSSQKTKQPKETSNGSKH